MQEFVTDVDSSDWSKRLQKSRYLPYSVVFIHSPYLIFINWVVLLLAMIQLRTNTELDIDGRMGNVAT